MAKYWAAEIIDGETGYVPWRKVGMNWQDMVLEALSSGALTAEDAEAAWRDFDEERGVFVDCDHDPFQIRPAEPDDLANVNA